MLTREGVLGLVLSPGQVLTLQAGHGHSVLSPGPHSVSAAPRSVECSLGFSAYSGMVTGEAHTRCSHQVESLILLQSSQGHQVPWPGPTLLPTCPELKKALPAYTCTQV